MLDQILIQSRPMFCYRHKKQPVTHICTDIKCTNNPILCQQCLNQGINRSYHYQHHQKSILPVNQSIQSLCQIIKNQSSTLQRIYKSTLGRGDYNSLTNQLQKGGLLLQQLDNRIVTIKNQVELQLQLLIKQFQKILLLQKQQYFKILQNYQRIFIKNYQYLRQFTQPILDFQNSIKYYSNKNTLYLKLASQTIRKSDWFMKTKKTLNLTAKNIENTAYQSQLNNLLNVSNRIKLDMWPTWKGQDSIEKSNQLKFVIKRAINQWAYIPELKSIQQELQCTSPTLPTGGLKNYYIQSNSNGK